MPVLLPDQPLTSLDEYIDGFEGGQGLVRCRELGPEGTLDTIERSGLRGRGGAGFPTGRKWASILAGGPEVGDRYAVGNGAEGEPGTFKDRMLMRRNPYQVVEGLAISAATVDAVGVYLAVKASFEPEIEALSRALREMSEAGLVGDVPISLVTGPEEYLFGEEKALLEVIEGEDPLPRLFPPYIYGLFTAMPQMGWSAGIDLSSDGVAVPSSNPTLVNNVETLANVVPILGRGADWYRSMGTDRVTGRRDRDRRRRRAARGRGGDRARRAVGRGHRTRGRRPAAGTDDQGRAVGRRQRRHHRARPRRAGELRRPGQDRQRPRVVGLHRVRRHRRHGRPWRARSRGFCTWSRAASARRASSVRARSPRTSTTSRPARGPTTTSR